MKCDQNEQAGDSQLVGIKLLPLARKHTEQADDSQLVGIRLLPLARKHTEQARSVSEARF